MALWLATRFSLRILRKHWKLTSIAVFSLAIALAAGAVGFSVFNALLLRPPVSAAPEQLVTVYSSAPNDDFAGFCYADYVAYRDTNEVFSSVMAFPYSIAVTPIVYQGRSRSGLVNAVSDTFFSVLGVRPMLGRALARGDDDQPSTLAVLSYPYWRSLGADPNVVGQSVQINGVPLTIIGVMPQGFAGTIFSDLPDVWYPFSTEASMNHQGPDWRTDRSARPLRLVGRLKAGITQTRAQANLTTIASQLAVAHPDTNKDRVARLTGTTMLPVDTVSSAKLIAALLLGIVMLILFAASSNVANLLLALSGARRHELLVRTAMGATRWRLIGEAVVDSTLVSLGGGFLGFVIASLAMRQLMQFKPYIPGLGFLPLTIDFRPDLRVLALTVVMVFVVGLATGLVPGLSSGTPNLAGALTGELAVGGTRKNRLRHALVAIQVAVCTLVLVAVGLCFRSLGHLRDINLGFSEHNVAVLTATLPPDRYAPEHASEFLARLRSNTAQVSGVQSVTIASDLPVSQNEGSVEQIHLSDTSSWTGRPEAIAFAAVDENYFATLGVPLLAGRAFSAADTAQGPPVVVINQLLAEKYWPQQNPLGKTLRLENGQRSATVVGVAANGKYFDFEEPPRPFIYFNLRQHYQPTVYVMARTSRAPRAWLNPLSQALQKFDPQIFFATLTMDDWLNFSLLPSEIALFCIAVFGGLAFVLATVGLYGAVFYSVSERKKELGIRVALGARPLDLWNMILRQTSVVTTVGILSGLLAGVVTGLLVRSLLYGMQPVEWSVLLLVALAMAAMTVLAAFSAARPWLAADPMKSVRHS